MITSPTNAERSIGAILLNVNRYELRNENHAVVDGHVVLKLNGEMVKTKSHLYILDRIRYCCDALQEITLVLERVEQVDNTEDTVSKENGACVTSSPPKVGTTDSVVVNVGVDRSNSSSSSTSHSSSSTSSTTNLKSNLDESREYSSSSSSHKRRNPNPITQKSLPSPNMSAEGNVLRFILTERHNRNFGNVDSSGSSSGTNNSYSSSDSSRQVSPSSLSECQDVLCDDQSPRSISSSTSGSSTNSNNASRNTSMHAILSCIPEGTESDISPDSSEILSTAAVKRTPYNMRTSTSARHHNLSKMTNRSYISSDSESSNISNYRYNHEEPTNNQALSSATQMYPTSSPELFTSPTNMSPAFSYSRSTCTPPSATSQQQPSTTMSIADFGSLESSPIGLNIASSHHPWNGSSSLSPSDATTSPSLEYDKSRNRSNHNHSTDSNRRDSSSLGASATTNGNTTAFFSPDVVGHGDTQKKLSFSPLAMKMSAQMTSMEKQHGMLNGRSPFNSQEAKTEGNSIHNSNHHPIECNPTEEETSSNPLDSCSISTVFHSPFSNLLPTTPNDINTISTKKSHISKTLSHHEVPISMLDCNYVQECDSIDTLERIIQSLSQVSPPEFPSLLRLAESRLSEIREKKVETAERMICNRSIDNEEEEEPPRPSTPPIPTIQQNFSGELTTASTTAVPSQIRFTNIFQHSETNSNEYASTNPTSSVDCNAHDDNETYDDESCHTLRERMNDIVLAHAELSDNLTVVLEERNGMQQDMASHIQTLETTIVDMENYMMEQNKVSSRNIQVLQKLKDEAEEDITHLREMVVTTSDEAKTVSIRLKHCKEDVRRLRYELEEEREEKLKILKQGDVVQNDLRSQVKNLSEQLQVYEEETDIMKELLEEVKCEFQAMSKENEETIQDLQQQLEESQRKLKRLERQNQKSTRQLDEDFKNRPKFKEILKEFAAAEACANSLAKALVESETELSNTVEANKKLLYKYSTLKKEKMELEEKNGELSEQILMLNEELKSSHCFIDNLYAQVHADKELRLSYNDLKQQWEQEKIIYEQKIHDLKARIDKASDMVAREVYDQEVAKTATLTQTLEEKEVEIVSLSNKVRHLEKLIDDKDETPKKGRAQASPLRRSIEIHDDSNVPSTSSKSTSHQASLNEQISHMNTVKIHVPRSSALQAVGGRAALNAKLKKTRGTMLQSQKTVKNINGDSKGGLGKRSALGSINTNNRMASGRRQSFNNGSGKENVSLVQ